MTATILLYNNDDFLDVTSISGRQGVIINGEEFVKYKINGIKNISITKEDIIIEFEPTAYHRVKVTEIEASRSSVYSIEWGGLSVYTNERTDS